MIAACSRIHYLAAVGSLLLATSYALPARADNPYEAELGRLAAETSRAGSSPRAILPLIELWRSWDNVPPEVAFGHLDRLASDRRLSPSVRSYARMLRAQARLRMGDPEASQRELNELGFVRDWRVIGPFDNEGKAGFEREYPPEAGRMGPIDLDAHYPGRERDVSWRTMPDIVRSGYVSFDAVFRPNANVCGFAETFVESDRAQPLSLFVGAGGAVRVWWNGEVVHEDAGYRTPHADRSVAMVGAQRGLNRVLIKACATDGVWGFFFRVADARGEPARGVTVRSSAPADEVARIAAGHGAVRLPPPPMTPFAALRDAATGEHPSAQALEDFARFLVYTGSDDPAEVRARELSARAAGAEPTVRRLALAATLANTRGETMRFSRRASELAPNDPDAILLAANIASSGPSPEAALPLVDRLPRGSRQWMQGTLIAADVLRTLGMPETARTRTEQAASLAPRAPAWIGARANAAGQSERQDELVRLRQELLAVRYDDLGARRTLMDDALARGDADTVLAHLAAYRAIAADRTQTYVMAAQIYEALDRSDEAFAALRQALDVAPEEPSLFVEHGRMLLRAGQMDAGAVELRRALALRPQDANTRELLEELAPQERHDEAYAASPDVLLARRGESSGGYPLTVLEDLTVNTVFDSGLGSSFHQMAVQIHDQEGARQWRTYGIQYDPDAQRVDVRQARVFRDGQQLSSTQTFEQPLGEPWYRMYYDTRALVVVFPDLEPGDVVEIQYRIDDVAPRNLFHDYYGDLRMLQSSVPMRRLDYVLITPSARHFYFNEPHMQRLAHDTREEDGRRIDHFHVDDVPALSSEPSMPGMTDVVPYLHVSTYRTWEEVGRWYWGLVRDQLYADEHLRGVVRQLVAGAPDTRTKVQRIYDWVIRNTRYVALEFGIHGFLPYRVPDIVSRGFGDCKDKASLIYTMLREAGIDARLVLLRTRQNGSIHDQPASLSVFDHAIAYVPELDLYLDGTAEQSGIEDLPQMDQGVTVLRVGPEDVTLTRTPVMNAERNQRSRQVTLTLTPDGSGTVQMSEEVRGVEAPSYRSRYQSEGVRRDRLEQQMRGLFPGLQLTESRFENLDDYNVPVRLRLEARAPQLAVRDGRLLRLAPTALHDLVRNLAPASARALPLDLGTRSSYVEERHIRVPSGWSVHELPDGGTLESPFGRLSIEVRAEGHEVVARTRLDLSQDRVSPEDYPAFRRWVEGADRILRQRLTLAPGGEQ